MCSPSGFGCMFGTNKAAGLELSSTLTPAPSLIYSPVRALKPSHAGSSTLFPRHLQHVSFLCGRDRKWNGKSAPPPTAATWQGRRAVGQEPAGHSRAYLWSAFSSLQSEALCIPAALHSAALSLRCLSHTEIQNLVRRTTRKDALSAHSLCPPPSPFPRLFILMGLTHEKGSPLCRNGGKGSGYISRAVHHCPSHSGQNGWLPSIGSLSLRHTHAHTHTVKPGER